MMNRSLVVLSTCILLLLSCVCSPKENSSGSNESKMTLLCWRETEQNVFRDGRPASYLLFVPLAHEDEQGYLRPDLMESWEHSEDYTEWTFHLRKDVRWHDGNPGTFTIRSGTGEKTFRRGRMG